MSISSIVQLQFATFITVCDNRIIGRNATNLDRAKCLSEALISFWFYLFNDLLNQTGASVDRSISAICFE